MLQTVTHLADNKNIWDVKVHQKSYVVQCKQLSKRDNMTFVIHTKDPSKLMAQVIIHDNNVIGVSQLISMSDQGVCKMLETIKDILTQHEVSQVNASIIKYMCKHLDFIDL